RTAVNVAGQALVPTIVAKREGIIDQAKYDSATAEDLFRDSDAESADRAEETEARDAVRTEDREPASTSARGLNPRLPPAEVSTHFCPTRPMRQGGRGFETECGGESGLKPGVGAEVG